MAITIVTTASSESANSYVSVTEADNYFDGMPWFESTWDALTTAQKNARLVQSARAIDALNFMGEKYLDDQAMEFPRTITDQSTDDGSIPQKVKDAQCELIAWQYQHLDSSTGEADRQIDELSIGKGELNLKYTPYRNAENNLAGAMPERVRALLGYWLIPKGNFMVERG